MATVELGSLPDRIDLTILAGRPFGPLDVPILQAGGAPLGFADVTAARAQVRQQIGSTSIYYTFATDGEGAELVDDAGDAVVRLTATSDTTSDWQALWPGSAPQTVMWWDLEITDADDEPHQITLPGTITLVHQVTR